MKRFAAHFACLLLLAAFPLLAIAQEAPKPAATPAFTAQLMLVKSDWSQRKDAKEIEAELRAALKDATVPQELLDKLPASGPRILFAPEVASLYTGENFAALFEWLKAHGLLVETVAAETQTKDGSGGGPSGPIQITSATLVRDYDFLALPALDEVKSQPFVARQAQWRWTVRQATAKGGWWVRRELVVSEKRQGQTDFTAGQPLDAIEFGVGTTADVVVANAFPSQGESTLRHGARQKGYEAVLIFQPKSAQTTARPAQPKLTLPQGVQVITVLTRDPRLTWPNEYVAPSVRPAQSVASAAPQAAPTQPSAASPATGPLLPPSAEAKPPFRASLILLQADWSKSPQAGDIKASLQAALKDVTVPQELRDKLPASGAQVLFPPGICGVYAATEFAELLGWLKSAKVVQEVIPFSEAQILQRSSSGFFSGEAPAIDSQAAVFFDYDRLKLPKVDDAQPQPFVDVKEQFQWSATLSVHERPDPGVQPELTIQRRLQISELARGQKTPTTRRVLEEQGLSCSLAEGRVAVVNAFPEEFDGFRRAATEAGFVAIVVVESAPPSALPSAAPSGKAALHLPSLVQTVSPSSANLSSGRGRRGGGDTYGNAVARGRGGQGPPPGRPAPANTPAAGTPIATQVTGREWIDVYQLQHMRAEALLVILQQLLGPNVRMTADTENQRVIVSSNTEEDAMKAGALIQRLDTLPAGASTAQPGARNPAADPNQPRYSAGSFLRQFQFPSDIPPQSPAVANSLAQQYQAAEQEAQSAAQQWRTLTAKSGDVQTSAEIAAAKARLQVAVAKAFEARQKLQQAELLEMQRRIYGLAGTIEDREKIKDQIIDRRVQELLNPALQWPAPPAAANAPTATQPQYPPTQPRLGEAAPQYPPVQPRYGEAPQPSPATSSAAATDPRISLTEAVRKENERMANDLKMKGFPPLTDDEVVASIRWNAMDPKKWVTSGLSASDLETVLLIAETRMLPPRAKLTCQMPHGDVRGGEVDNWAAYLSIHGPNRSGGLVGPILPLRRQFVQWTPKGGSPSFPLQGAGQADVPDGMPLEAAINGFNERAKSDAIGKDQPPLTLSEVIAALRWQSAQRTSLPITNAEFLELEKVAETGQLPPKAELEVITSFQPNDELLFDAWSVRLRMPRAKDGGSYAFIIRERWLRVKKLKERDIAWGPVAQNGLQVGLSLEPSSDVLTKGQQIVPHFHFRNAGTKNTAISLPRLLTHSYYNSLEITDDTGAKIEIEQDPGPGGPVGWVQTGFPAGAEREVIGLPIAVGQVKRAPGVETVICAEPGQQCRLKFDVGNYLDASSKEPLQTGEVRFALAKE